MPSLKTGEYTSKRNVNVMRFYVIARCGLFLSMSDCSLLKTAPQTHCQRVDFG